jgi:hypothetical protein
LGGQDRKVSEQGNSTGHPCVALLFAFWKVVRSSPTSSRRRTHRFKALPPASFLVETFERTEVVGTATTRGTERCAGDRLHRLGRTLAESSAKRDWRTKLRLMKNYTEVLCSILVAGICRVRFAAYKPNCKKSGKNRTMNDKAISTFPRSLRGPVSFCHSRRGRENDCFLSPLSKRGSAFRCSGNSGHCRNRIFSRTSIMATTHRCRAGNHRPVSSAQIARPRDS